MGRRGTSAAVFGVTIGIILAGGIALRPVIPAQTAAVLDTATIEGKSAIAAAVASDTAAAPVASTVSVPAPAPVEI
ncbi:MAG: hypothetical protein ACRDF9_15430, partial [Candidatus Limnocylindria bacterium]